MLQPVTPTVETRLGDWDRSSVQKLNQIEMAEGPDDHAYFMRQAIALSAQAGIVERTGACFGAVVVKDGVVVGEGYNQVTSEVSRDS